MKIVLGIVLVTLVVAALGLYLYFMMNSEQLVYCGDITSVSGNKVMVTRVYTSDLNADETLSEIVTLMNAKEDGLITAEEMTEILATYQNIIYAPVVMMYLEQKDTDTFVLTGSMYDGLDEEGQPTEPDYKFKNLSLTAGVKSGEILAAQNVYSDFFFDEQVDDEEFEPEFSERKKVVDPIVVNNNQNAAFAFHDCEGFRLVFKSDVDEPAEITVALTYDVQAENPLNFTSLSEGAMAMTITEGYDERGNLAPQLLMSRVYTSEDTETEE